MRIVIVDDDRLVCSSLKVILEMDSEIKVDAIGNDGSEAIKLYEMYTPDVLLMDIRMATMSGIEAAEQILAKHKNAKILFLTTFSDDEYIVKALKIGAKGYLLKQDYDSILPALKAVSIGQSVFGSDVVTKLPDLMQKKKEFPYEEYQLTKKEYELLRMVAEGLSNKEIADAMFLSEGTVRNYLSNLLLKLDVRDRTQAAIFYYKQMQ
ncbi:response regulator transcription factor [Lachnoclostridium phytofermentans]|uniref:response regulator transcription factor n=1 Tax=Lachnoclostridium phytofermentans TaxID=66219 RepID=UPI000495E7FD|nr:response regulator transcription factor [Lachnoclostridium phytofermentans]